MNAELFRTEVLQRQAGADMGDVLQWEPPRGRVLLLLFVLLFAMLVAFAALAPVSRGDVVRGVLSPDAGLSKLHVPASGQVQQVLVREGQRVAQGDALLHVIPAAFAVAGPQTHRFVADALVQQQSVLQAQRSLLQTRQRTDNTALEQRRLALLQTLALQEEQQGLLQQRLALAGQALQRSATLLERQLIAPAVHAQALEAQVIARQALVSQSLELKRVQEALLIVRLEAQQRDMDNAAEALRLESALSQLQVQQREQAQQALMTLRAPGAGRVGSLLVSAGMPVDPARPVLTLLPDSGELIALLFVPSRAAGQLRAGQSVQLIYDAFPQSIHGSFPARISMVSEATVDPREYLVPFDTPEPVFLVQALLESGTGAVSSPASLRAGMQFSAHVRTGRESLLARITAPLRRLEPLL